MIWEEGKDEKFGITFVNARIKAIYKWASQTVSLVINSPEPPYQPFYRFHCRLQQ